MPSAGVIVCSSVKSLNLVRLFILFHTGV